MLTFKTRVAPMAALLAIVLGCGSQTAQADVNVVASIPELGAIAKELGGDKVSVYSVARPNSDYHAVEARPSDVARVGRAGLVIRTGLAPTPGSMHWPTLRACDASAPVAPVTWMPHRECRASKCRQVRFRALRAMFTRRQPALLL
jgi:hypothetical protein